MKMKRIDFDIDLAKKIQAGKAQGRIVTRDGLPARVICWDMHNPKPIVALIENETGNEGQICTYGIDGKYYSEKKEYIDLLIEAPAPQFQPFDRVLVREDGLWRCALYSHFDEEVGEHMCTDGLYYYFCIPYEGNEHLVGTTDEPKE